MNKTHYESLIESQFSIKALFEKIEPYISTENFTWDDLTQIPIIKEITEEALKEKRSEDVLTIIQVIYHSYAFYKGSGRVYEVSESIAEMLLNTKLNIDVSMVKSPFREIMILVPEKLVQIYNRNTGMHNVYTLYVNMEERSDTDKTLKVMCVGRENAKSKDLFDDAIFYFKIECGPGTIMESLQKGIDEWKRDPIAIEYSTINDTEIMPRLFQFVLNILLYITSVDCDITLDRSHYNDMEKSLQNLHSSTKIRKLKQKMERESRLNRYVIGRSIKLSPEEVTLYNAIHSGQHKVRYPVGGHWRMQPYGPRDIPIKKPKWIRPHFRGPEIAELIRSIGVLK